VARIARCWSGDVKKHRGECDQHSVLETDVGTNQLPVGPPFFCGVLNDLRTGFPVRGLCSRTAVFSNSSLLFHESVAVFLSTSQRLPNSESGVF